MLDKQICGQCGKVHVTYHGHQACKAHIVGSDPLVPCSKYPKGGTGLCRSHGANLPTVAAAGAQRLAMMAAQGEIAELMRECDIPEQHPIDGLLEVVRVSGSMMRLLTIKVGELAEDPSIEEVLVEGPGGALSTKRVATDEAFWGLNAQGEMTPSIYVQLLKVWTERYERACKTALEAGIEERRIRLAEDTSETFFNALAKAVMAAGLSPEMREQLNMALADELRRTNAIEVSGS